MLTLLRYGWRVARGSTIIVVVLAVTGSVLQALFTLTIGLVVAAVPAFLAGAADRSAMVALFVAFSTLIVVLDRGRILEVGSHEELLAARGHYAELFELQARAYR